MEGFQPSVACLFRQVPNVVAKALGFSTSTRRPYRTLINVAPMRRIVLDGLRGES